MTYVWVNVFVCFYFRKKCSILQQILPYVLLNMYHQLITLNMYVSVSFSIAHASNML